MIRTSALLPALLLSAGCFAQNLLGAENALERIGKQYASKSPASQLMLSIEAFKKEVPSLSPEEAGRRWAMLALEASQAKPQGYRYGNELEGVVAVLPPPESWPAITAAMADAAKQSPKSASVLSMRLFAHLLQGDVKAQWADLAAIKPLATSSMQKNLFLNLSQSLAFLNRDAERASSILLERVRASAQEQDDEDDEYGDYSYVRVPNLAPLLGREKTEALCATLIKVSAKELYFENAQTKGIAAAVLRKNLSTAKTAHFTLACSFDSTDLYAQISARFPQSKSSFKRLAQGFYVAKMIADGKGSSVANQAGSLESLFEGYNYSTEALAYFDTPQRAKLLADFLDGVVQSKPNLDLWDTYVVASVKSRQSDRAISRLQAALSKTAAGKSEGQSLRRHLITLYLAEDRLNDALPLIRKGINEQQGTIEATRLLQIGKALKRQDLLEEGLKAQMEWKGEREYYSYGYSDSVSIAQTLIALKRYAQAESYIIDSVKSEQESYGSYMASNMSMLVEMYAAAGRYADAVTVLNESSFWNASDVGDLNISQQSTLLYPAALSLARTGNKAAALRLVNRLIELEPGYDPAYELMIELEGDRAMARIDSLVATYLFEERPLIWKAKLLYDRKQYAEAEQAIQKAIAIDPSDGETKEGRRMYGYAVFADIKEALGQKDQADLYRSAVKAIRMSEEADELLAAGFYSRAIKLYESSITVFADAYCIQSRLAIQLAEQGRYEEAEQHYRRAFELMPDSFGRMETHCFGCEGVFREGPAATVAERVFSQLLRETPNKPQVHYLTGYLRMEQERYAEAAALFWKAVELDPDYINAWNNLRAISSEVLFTPEQLNKIADSLVRLSKRGLSSSQAPNTSIESADLKSLYRIHQSKVMEREDGKLYPLKNSKPRAAASSDEEMLISMMTERARPSSPGATISNLGAVRLLLQFASNLR